jgi:dTDP-4-amino-4,6-dideoxygalactose transaminase
LREWRIPLYKVYWDENDVEAVTKIIKRGTYWTAGPEIEEFERVVANYVGVKYGVSFNSGTSALHAALLAYEIKQGDEVIVPSFTFIATANAPLFVGAKPVFADIEDSTFGLDPNDVERKITRRTKAIMPIHYGGLPCRIKELRKIAQEYNLLLIEDAAESLGASVDGRKVGSFGDAAMFSFCGNKVITTGEGGIIVTNSSEIYERLKLIRSHGRLESEPYFMSTKTLDYIMLGYNWRISSITAALGLAQMKKLDRIIEMRRKNAEYITSKLSKIDEVKVPQPPEGYFHVYQMYTIRVKGGRGVRDALKDHLAKKGIMSKVYFEPVHLTHFYREKFGFKGGELPVTERLSSEVLTLPLYPTMTIEEMDYIIESIKEFFQNKRA